MQIGEAKISALAVSALTGVGLTLMLNQALRDLGYALSMAISVPITLLMGGVLFLFANDNMKKGGSEPPPEKPTKGN
jgi:ATP/ADP translocase